MTPRQISVCLIPPSRSHEDMLAWRLYGYHPIPPGSSLIDELVEHIQQGLIDLQPTAESGWYDFQTYALEPLLRPEQMPEAAKLSFSERYLRELTRTFKAAIALTRETHIKQLPPISIGMAIPPEIIIYPHLTLEPIAETYLRRAQAYKYIRDVLERFFGLDPLRQVRRMRVRGLSELPLIDELKFMQSLLESAYIVTLADLGLNLPADLAHDFEIRADQAHRFFTDWLAKVNQDPELGEDLRMMVPVFYDEQRELTKVWVFLGYVERILRISFATPPKAFVTTADGDQANVTIGYRPRFYKYYCPISAEIYVDQLLNRNEFRTLCDKHKTYSEILNAIAKEQ